MYRRIFWNDKWTSPNTCIVHSSVFEEAIMLIQCGRVNKLTGERLSALNMLCVEVSSSFENNKGCLSILEQAQKCRNLREPFSFDKVLGTCFILPPSKHLWTRVSVRLLCDWRAQKRVSIKESRNQDVLALKCSWRLSNAYLCVTETSWTLNFWCNFY